MYWAGDYENGECKRWVYMPVSTKILDELVREEYTFHESFSESKRLMLVSTFSDKKRITTIEPISHKNLSLVNLPPQDFSIDPEDIQSFAPEAKWDFNLRIAKKSGNDSPSNSAVTDTLDSFSEVVQDMMKDARNKYPSIHPLTAEYGSFDVKLGSSNQERAAVAIELLESLLEDANELEARLEEYNVDPYRLKNLLDIVSINKLDLTLKSKTSNILRRPITINAIRLKPIIDKLEEITLTIIDSLKVPQANSLDRVISIVKHRAEGGELEHKFIDGISSPRQVQYHAHAARCLGLLNSDYTLTTAGRVLVQKCSTEAQYEFLADRVESSDFGWAWMQWSGVKSIADLDPNSSGEFVLKCVKGLNGSSIKRRASSLSAWVKLLKQYRRDYSQ